MKKRTTSQIVICAEAIAHQGHNSQPSSSPTIVEETPLAPAEPAPEVLPATEPSAVVPTVPPTQSGMMPLLGELIFVLLVATPVLLFTLRRKLSAAE